MRYLYACGFPAGFKEVVKKALKEKDPRSALEWEDESLICFKSNLSPQEIKKTPFFSLSFLVLSSILSPPLSLDSIAFNLFKKAFSSFNPSLLKTIGLCTTTSFRLTLSLEGYLRKITPSLKTILLRRISKNFNLCYNPHRANLELWILGRRKGFYLLGIKLNKREKRKKGQLSKEVAYLLNFISQPRKDDVFLDPFSGSSAIPLSRAKYFPYKEIIAIDKDLKKVKDARLKLRKHPNTKVLQGNTLYLKHLLDKKVDVIVTDPPWGLFQSLELKPNLFYSKMLREFYWILKPKGRLVILAARKQEIEKAIRKTDFLLLKSYNVLIAGKKAVVYHLAKT